MYVSRMPIVVLDELGKLLTSDRRAQLMDELARNPNTSATVIRDRLALYGVSPATIDEVVNEFERLRATVR